MNQRQQALIRRSDLTGNWYVVTRYERTRDAVVAYEKHDVTRDVILIQRMAQAEAMREVAKALLTGRFADPVDPAEVARWLLTMATETEPNGECPICGLTDGHAMDCWFYGTIQQREAPNPRVRRAAKEVTDTACL